MALLLLDLDNTLVDRAGAFRAWASDFVDRLGLSPSEVDWLIRADKDGYEGRDVLAQQVRDRFGLDDRGESDVLRTLRLGLVDRMVLRHRLCRAHVAALDPTSPMRDHEQLGPDRRSDAPDCS